MHFSNVITSQRIFTTRAIKLDGHPVKFLTSFDFMNWTGQSIRPCGLIWRLFVCLNLYYLRLVYLVWNAFYTHISSLPFFTISGQISSYQTNINLTWLSNFFCSVKCIHFLLQVKPWSREDVSLKSNLHQKHSTWSFKSYIYMIFANKRPYQGISRRFYSFYAQQFWRPIFFTFQTLVT